MPTMPRLLTTPILVIFGLAYMVPLGVFTTYGQVTVLSQGHLPIAYVITLVMIFFTALSYARMSRKLPIAGSAYTYTQRTFGAIPGFAIGWVQILDYLFLPIINYILLGLYINEAFPMIPAWIIILAAIISVTAFNYVGIKLVTPINLFLVLIQLLFVVLFVTLSLSSADLSAQNLLQPLTPAFGDMSGIIAGAAMLCLAFLGFDAIATMAEETQNAPRTLPRAIMFTIFIAGMIFMTVSFSANIAYPDWLNFIEPSQQDTASLKVIHHVGETSGFGGKLLSDLFLAAFLTGSYASAMISQTSVSRILFAMGREGVISRKRFFKLHPKFNTPSTTLIILAMISLVAIFMPLTLVVSMISFGALVAFTAVNACVIKHYCFNNRFIDQPPHFAMNLQNRLRYGLMPAIGMALSIWLWLNLDANAMMIGISWFIAGILYLTVITRGFKRPTPQIDEQEIKAVMRANESK